MYIVYILESCDQINPCIRHRYLHLYYTTYTIRTQNNHNSYNNNTFVYTWTCFRRTSLTLAGDIVPSDPLARIPLTRHAITPRRPARPEGDPVLHLASSVSSAQHNTTVF